MASKSVLGIVLAGGAGNPPQPADGGPGETGRPVRRPVPADRLRAVQPGQRRHPEDLRAHPVQEPQPGPAHLHHVADELPARQLRDPGPGPAAARPALVHRLGRRHLPVDEPDQRRAAGHRGRLRRRPRVPDGPDADDRPPRAAGRGRDRGGHPGAAQRGVRVRRISAAGRHGRSTRSWRSPPTRRPCRATRTRRYSSMGNYVFDTDVLVDALRKDADDEASPHDIGGNIIPKLVRSGARTPTTSPLNEVPGATARDAATGATSARSTSYFDAHMDLCAVEPIFNLYNDQWPILTLRAVAAAGQVRARGGGPDRAGDRQPGQPRRGDLRRAGPPVRALARGAGEQLGHRGAVGAAAQHRGSAGTRWSGTRSSTRTSWCRRGRRSAWTRTTTGRAASRSRPAASPWWARARRSYRD